MANPEQSLNCPEPNCDGPMVLRHSKFGLFYGCSNYPKCKATHGAHPNGKPMGIPADKVTKQWRILAHAAFDPLWKEAYQFYDIKELNEVGIEKAKKRITRAARHRAYAWLAAQMELSIDDCHIGLFDKEECRKVITLCMSVNASDIRSWFKKHSNQQRCTSI